MSNRSSNPAGIARGKGKVLWFTEEGANKIGKISMSGTITEYPVPTSGSDPFGITDGPDHKIWFVEKLGNKLGTMTRK